MNRNVQSLLMVAAGGVLLWIAFDGAYLRYVRQAAFPWIVASSVALVLIGLVLLWADNEARLAARILREPELAERRPRHTADHDHGTVGRVVPWLLVLPLLALFLVQPRELGAFTAERSRAAQVDEPAATGGFALLVGDDPVEVSLLDLNQRALYGGARTLSGRTLLLTGFVTQRKGAADGEFYLNRLMIACCAADAIPIRASVRGAPSSYRTETWVEVTGRYAGTQRSLDPNLDPLPVIEVTSVQRIPVPKEPYAT